MKQLILNELNLVTGGICECVCKGGYLDKPQRGGGWRVATAWGCENMCKRLGLQIAKCEEVKE